MPARHDILCGALDFLWRPWGSIELWEQPITDHLRDAGVVTMLVSDHPHLFETGGENYHTDFYRVGLRARPRGRPVAHVPRPDVGRRARRCRPRAAPFAAALRHVAHVVPRGDDFPGPRMMRAAADWLRGAAPAARPVAALRRRVRSARALRHARAVGGPLRPRLGRRPHHLAAVRRRRGGGRRLTEAEARHIRANYGAKLSMIDHWFGRMLDAIDESDGAGTTRRVIVCTDHGHYLGEKDIWGKPGVMQYEPLGHMPLLVAGRARRRVHVRRAHHQRRPVRHPRRRVRARVPQRTHGVSLVPLLEGTATSVRELGASAASTATGCR